MQDQTSHQALARLRDGGEHALAELFVSHREQLRRMVRKRLGLRLSKRVDASDILQEGFVDAARRLDGYLQRPTMPLMLWLGFLLRQRVAASYRTHMRCQKRDVRKEESSCAHRADSQPTAIPKLGQHCTRTPSAVVSRGEELDRLVAAIDRLEPLDREIIRLRHELQLNNACAAEQLGLSPSAASKRYVRALTRLRRLA